MHKSSYLNMSRFITEYLDPSQTLRIVDLGSQAIAEHDSYKSLCASPKWTYIGCDIVDGNNVDVVLTNAYNWKELAAASVDVVISGQAFEHIEFPWVTMSEISRVLKDGGLCCIIAPSNGVYHGYPVDCWRYYEDGMRALAKYVDMEVLEVQTQRSSLDFADYDKVWQDTVLICRKPEQRSLAGKFSAHARQSMNRYLVKSITWEAGQTALRRKYKLKYLQYKLLLLCPFVFGRLRIKFTDKKNKYKALLKSVRLTE